MADGTFTKDMLGSGDGLDKGGYNFPIIKMRCKISDYDIAIKSFGKGENAKSQANVVLKCTGVTVLKLREGTTWPYPTAEIEIKASSSANSKFGLFDASAHKMFPQAKGITKFDDLFNKILKNREIVMEYTLEHDIGMTKKDKEGKDVPAPIDAWEIVEVVGAVNISPMDYAKKLLNGKTEDEFNKAAAVDSVVQSDAALYNSVLQKQFIQALSIAGAAKLGADGRYVVTGI